MSAAVNKTILKNGIRIVTKKMPHVRSISMGVWLNVGARDESETESGLSHFIEHMIFKGTEKRTSFQIAKEFDSIGGHTNAFFLVWRIPVTTPKYWTPTLRPSWKFLLIFF